MLKRTSTPSKKQLYAMKNCSISSQFNKRSIGIQTDLLGKCLSSTNTSSYLDDIIMQGKNMNDNEFEKFIKGK